MEEITKKSKIQNERRNKMNPISKYLVTTKDERKVLFLARTLRRSYTWGLEDSEFFYQNYSPTRTALDDISRGKPYDRDVWGRAFREASKECIQEAQCIKRRELSYKNLAYNLGVFALEGIIGGTVNLIGGFGGGIHYIPDEGAYRPNYKSTSPK